MARYLDSKFGKIKPYKTNPRKISDGAFTKLCESISTDPEFMETRPIVIDEEGSILGGNQRQYALLSLMESGWSREGRAILKLHGWECVMEGRLPDAWIKQLVKPSWLSDEEWEAKKQRFVLKDNSPEGMAGEFDYEIMEANFSAEVMADSGIDFAELTEDIQAESFESSEETAEKSDYGEKNEKLETFKEHREKARETLEDMTDVRFYLCAVFQNHDQVRQFLDAVGVPSEGELFVDGLALAEKLGIEVQKVKYEFPEGRTDKKLVEMAMENDQEPRKDAGNAQEQANLE